MHTSEAHPPTREKTYPRHKGCSIARWYALGARMADSAICPVFALSESKHKHRASKRRPSKRPEALWILRDCRARSVMNLHSSTCARIRDSFHRKPHARRRHLGEHDLIGSAAALASRCRASPKTQGASTQNCRERLVYL